MEENPKFLRRVESFLHSLVCFIFRVIVTWLYGEKGQSMPPINDVILLESASSLALKIRTKQVTSNISKKNILKKIKKLSIQR